MTTLSCKIVSVETITNTVYRVHLLPNGTFSFRAGQYLIVIINESNKHPFSLASTPSEKKLIELHIGVSEFNIYARTVMEHILAQDSINIDIPHGKAWFRKGSTKPIILIAGGTGFSYTRAILYAALEENPDRDITLYWGGRKLKHLYDLSALQFLAKQYRNIKIIPVVEQPGANWQGKTGTVLSAVLDDFNSLSKYEIYIAGRFEMAHIAREYFCNEKGMSPENLYGDAFDFI
ncbi:MAG: NAD(P)H-flavin reductase [Candidatus Arsenophonus melophagi]|nr:NAD(P)H-flavin reductase [Candidatus Arsenophonus melophagi]